MTRPYLGDVWVVPAAWSCSLLRAQPWAQGKERLAGSMSTKCRKQTAQGALASVLLGAAALLMWSSSAGPVEPANRQQRVSLLHTEEIVRPSVIERGKVVPEVAREELFPMHKLFQPLFDPQLSKWMHREFPKTEYMHCQAGLLQLNLDWTQMRHVMHREPVEEGAVITSQAMSVPCKEFGCCEINPYLRTGTFDVEVYSQVFGGHGFRFLYPLVDSFKPKYILDAGANCGMSSMLFKLLFPEATVVALEPDSSNYDAYRRNTERLGGIYALNAGLWGNRTKIKIITHDYGSWGKMFKPAPMDSDGLDAYSVQDLKDLLNIPAFDIVKIDIEGAEGPTFAPEMDTTWLDEAQVLIMETHDRFAERFGLKDVSTNLARAFQEASRRSKLHAVDDGEHIWLFADNLRDEMLKARPQQARRAL